MKKRSILGNILLLAIVIILVSTRPNEAKYTSWLKQNVRDNNPNILVQIGVDVLGDTVIQRTTTYKDYYLFTYADTKVGSQFRLTAIGILNTFIPFRVEK